MNYNELFDANGIFAETENYILRRIQPEELPCYEKLAQKETPDFLQNTSLSGSASLAWEDLLAEDHLTCSILKKDSGAFCGFCQLQWVFSSTPELGIDLLAEYQKQGVAVEILPVFLSQAEKILPIDHFYSKIKKNNIPSQRLAEKIGGICIGTKNLLPEHFPAEMASFAEKEFPDLFYLEYHFYTKKE